MVEVAAKPRVNGGSELVLEDLCKTYGSVVAVENFTATVAAGEFFTILGPSGSGKTTTMLMVAGFSFPSKGDIRLGGQSIARLPPQARGIGMVFQNYAVFPHLTVRKNVEFPLRVRRMPSREIGPLVDEMLDLVQLGSYGDRMPGELSGGQQQRVALARALVFKPPVLLMDEPLGALDKKLREHMQVEIRRLQRQLGLTMIYVTHDQEEALTMSDRVAIMNHGRLVQVGSPDDLYNRPDNRFVADFLGESNFIEGTVIATDGKAVRVRAVSEFEFSGATSQSFSVGARVVAAIRPEKLTLDREHPAHTNVWCGRVSDVVFAGAVTRYRAEGGELSLSATVQNRLAIGLLPIGAPVTFTWSVEETRVFGASEKTKDG